jgi:hypothetical protein
MMLLALLGCAFLVFARLLRKLAEQPKPGVESVGSIRGAAEEAA